MPLSAHSVVLESQVSQDLTIDTDSSHVAFVGHGTSDSTRGVDGAIKAVVVYRQFPGSNAYNWTLDAGLSSVMSSVGEFSHHIVHACERYDGSIVPA